MQEVVLNDGLDADCGHCSIGQKRLFNFKVTRLRVLMMTCTDRAKAALKLWRKRNAKIVHRANRGDMEGLLILIEYWAI